MRSRETVSACDPVRQDVVDGSGFNCALSSARQLKRTALPQEVRIHALVDGYWTARAIGVARGIRFAQIDPVITTRPLQPLVQQYQRFAFARVVSSLHRAVDHVEMGVAVLRGP